MNSKTLSKTRIDHVISALPGLIGNAESNQSQQLSIPKEQLVELLTDYYRLMEIAHYVRRGGIKAMIYRLETGRTKFVPVDYFDDAQMRLLTAYQDLLQPVAAASANQDQYSSLLDRLKSVSTDEETAVADVLPAVDQLLLSPNRQAAILADELPGSV